MVGNVCLLFVTSAVVLIRSLIKMESKSEKCFMIIFMCCALLKSAHCIECYQCSGTDSEHPFDCNEYLAEDTDLVPTDCSTIHNARFCVKLVGRYEGGAIACYQCSSADTPECGDALMALDGGALVPGSCRHVHGAKHCIKMIGGISTKRFCSPLDLGNDCRYVRQPGDRLEYRTCLYTCGADGCNAAAAPRAAPALLAGAALALLTGHLLQRRVAALK